MVMQSDDALDDFTALGIKLALAIDALNDPDANASGSDAAALARTRRLMPHVTVESLTSDYNLLGEALALSSGSGAASVANERRMIRSALVSMRPPEGVTKVAELASYRAARSEAAGAPARRRASGRSARGD